MAGNREKRIIFSLSLFSSRMNLSIRTLLFGIGMVLCTLSVGQNSRIQNVLNEAAQIQPLANADAGKRQHTSGYVANDIPAHPVEVCAVQDNWRKLANNPHTSSYPQNKGDTLWVGIAPYIDSLVLTGTHTYAWPIVVLNKALLRIRNGNVTVNGDLVLLGHGRVISDHSTLHFPQQYFYQRHILLLQNTFLQADNDTLDYGGFVHGLTVTDSARLVFNQVYQTDFMTSGVSKHASLSNSNTNLAGEYIMVDEATLNFKKCKTLLLWHHMTDTAIVNWTFPKGDSVYQYQFNKTRPGVKGVEYAVMADSCYKVMWGLMPTNGSDVTISNSTIRSIGLWFEKNNTVTVSGLVDQSHYSNYSAPISDRNLHLLNDSVITWSLYPMNKSKVNLSNSTVGEIGTYGKSQVNGTFYSVDGSGGYHYASDTSSTLANALFATCALRSERSGLMVMVNSTMYSGAAVAIDESVLIVLQSTLTQDPLPLDKSAAWLGTIGQLSSNTVDTAIQINGSAWITRTATSKLMDFAGYQMSFQKQGATSWTPITPFVTTKKSNALLGTWNTAGLVPGNYVLRLKLKDTWGDTAFALKNITLLPRVLAIHESQLGIVNLTLYPNPVEENLRVVFESTDGADLKLILSDLAGNEILQVQRGSLLVGENTWDVNLAALADGTYLLRLKTCKGEIAKKVVVAKKR
jgi:hypothetical protein